MKRFWKRKEKLSSLRSCEEPGAFSDAGEGHLSTNRSRHLPAENSHPNSGRRHTTEPIIQHAAQYSLSVPEYSCRPPSRHGLPEPTTAPTDSSGTTYSVPSPLPTNPLGLTLVYSFREPVIDIIFVHGLGGTSVGTWSWNRDPVNFWPLWLGNDRDLSRSRIFTFGYDAGLTGNSTGLGILDFAKDLLLRMKTYSSDLGGQMGVGFGRLPIIFVVHSMGGLVFKKAFILGKHDSQFSDMIANVGGVVFLGTPHKGTHLAHTLNSILRITPLTNAKRYVAELERNSGALQDINEQFRNMCSDIHLVSFYESLKTNLGAGMKKLIVEKESGILDYPGETSSPLRADHHSMAKFETPLDANFTNVTNVLRWLMKKVASPKCATLDRLANLTIAESAKVSTIDAKFAKNLGESEVDRLRKILGVTDNIEEENDYFTERVMQGSCQWLLRKKGFTDWLSTSHNSSQILWITGPPGSGKSVLSSFVIGLLRNRPSTDSCQHHFFLAGHRQKRTISYLLRGIAFQAAVSFPCFGARLIDLHEGTDITFEQQKVSFIWEKIFEGLLFRIPDRPTMFWVIDGLDEAESPTDFLKLLSRTRSTVKLNIMLVSRATKDLSNDIADLLQSVSRESLETSDTAEDIRQYVSSAIQNIFPLESGGGEIVQEIVTKASGSFLWVKLVLEKLRDNWYTQDDIRKALDELPIGMEPLYERMMDSISRQPEKTRMMALRILTWVTCAFVPLEVTDLEVALKSEFRGFVNLGRTAEEICGQFVLVNKSKITLVHHTARQFLLRKGPNPPLGTMEEENHKNAALVCMQFLSDISILRQVFSSMQLSRQSRDSTQAAVAYKKQPFLLYSLSYWAYHVSQSSISADEFPTHVLGFLEQHCLWWINGAVLTGDLRILIRAAQHLKAFVKRRTTKANTDLSLSLTMARDLELRQWANDIIRIVGRFGSNLLDNPSSIHKHVIPFCPKDTIIARRFGASHQFQSTFSVDGIASANWDDCLARISIGDGRIASQLLCKDTIFITLIATGGVMVVFRAETLEEIRRVSHGEYVMQIASSKTSNLVATAGFHTIRIWDITTGVELQRFPKERHHHAKALAFGEIDAELYVAFDDGEVKCFDIESAKEKWQFSAMERESHNYSCSRFMAFSPDRTKIALIFRGRPLLLWHIQPSPEEYMPPRKCVLAQDRLRSVAQGEAFNSPELAIWHPVTNHLLILYEDTKIVEWNIFDDEQLVYSHTRARSMSLSHDGNFLLTSDVSGSLSIWSLPGYRLTYQVKHDELVIDLAFSPDGTRFYDLRGSFCNVWEPDVLIQADDLDYDDKLGVNKTITSEPVLASDNHSRTAITSLACGPSVHFYCAGKEDGSVTIYDMQTGERLRKVTNHSTSSSVIKLEWSKTGRFLGSVDDSGRLIVKRLDAPTAKKNKWAVFPVCDIRMDNNEAIEQIHFSADEDYLLISSSTSVCVWGLKARNEICRSGLSPSGGIWQNYPGSSASIVRITGTGEQQYMWHDLSSMALCERSTTAADDQASTVPREKIRVVQIGEKWLLIEVTIDGDQERVGSRRSFELLDLATIELDPQPGRERTSRYHIKGLNDHVKELIGCSQDRVVFLDHQYWVCTWEVELNYTNHKRHFFLPKDWIDPITLKMVLVNKHGTILYPKGGDVAIIKSDV
ncbi:hypothetical protein F4859DRAFT_520389 [Xylaria cf. heliscus]|nr:hypothetical protein F4859DRAFT_520389 [Xylaria cf. heliscus]